MNKLLTIVIFLIGLILSCSKTSDLQNSGEAEWIKLVADSPVYFIGKIREDAQRNLYCCYYRDMAKIDDKSAIVMLNDKGNRVWRRPFDSLAIYDFLGEETGILVASCDREFAALTRISSSNTVTPLGQYPLPDEPGFNVREVLQMKILPLDNGHYVLSGTADLVAAGLDAAGFAMEIDESGTTFWNRIYFYPLTAEAGTSITGCADAGDGLMFIGNVQNVEPWTSSFFVQKTTYDGTVLFTKFYETSSYDADSYTYSGYYCATSDIIPAGDGNFFFCAFNVLFNNPGYGQNAINSPDDNSVRVFEINEEGDTLRSLRIKYDIQNMVADLVKRSDGGLFIALNPYFLVNFGLVGERHSFVAKVSRDLQLESAQSIQAQYTDYLSSVYKMTDGHYALLTMIQSQGKEHYYLEVVKTDENANF